MPSHRRRDVSAGFDAHQEIIKIGIEVRCIIRRRHAVDAPQAIGLRASILGRSGDAARSSPARDVSSPDRLSIVVSWTALRDSAFLPCFSSMGLNAWRLPFLQRVPVSPVPRLPWYYEAATTSRRARPSAYVIASGVHMPWYFVFACSLPMLAKSGHRAWSVVEAGVPRRLSMWAQTDLSGFLATHPVLCPARRPRPNSRCCPRIQRGEGFSTTMISRLATGLRYPLFSLHERYCHRPSRLASGWRAPPFPGGRRTLWVTMKGI